MTPAGTSNELDVQNEWEENTHTHTQIPHARSRYSNSIINTTSSEFSNDVRLEFSNDVPQPNKKKIDLAWQSIIIVGGNIKPALTGRFTRCFRRWAGPKKEVLSSNSLNWAMLLGSGVSKKKSGQRLLSGYGGGQTYVVRNGAGVILGGGCIVPKIFDLTLRLD